MAKKVDGPFVAVAVEIPENAPTECRPGTVGILEVWESERKWPGKRGFCFYYPLVAGLGTSRYLRVSYSYDLSVADDVATFEKEGSRYRFRIGEPMEEEAIK